MSHHFDTPTAKRPPHQRLRLLFVSRRPGTTVMALTVNPNAGVGGPTPSGRRSLRLSLRHESRSSRRSRLQVLFARPPTTIAASTGRSESMPAPTGADALERAAGELIMFREYGTRGESGSRLPGLCRPRAVSIRLRWRRFMCFRKALWSENRLPRRRSRIARNFFGGNECTPSSSRSLQPDRPRCGARLGHRIALRATRRRCRYRRGPAMITHILLSILRCTTHGHYNARVPADEVGAVSQTDRDFVEKPPRSRLAADHRLRYATPRAPPPRRLPYEWTRPPHSPFAAFNGRAPATT